MALPPLHIAVSPEVVITGMRLTVTVILSVLLHPLAAPVTEYVVEMEGVAVTVDAEVLFNPATGNHE